MNDETHILDDEAAGYEDEALDEVEGEEAPEVDEASQQMIEAFLAQTGSAVGEVDAAADWHEESVPEGHRSGFVVLIGRPNVGKSTLVNAFVGHKVAIVSQKPQTTRTRVRGILTQPDYQLVFTDTPGIHEKPPHKLNERMISEAASAIPDADVILFVVDVSVPPQAEDRTVAQMLQEKAERRPVIFVLNKMDQLSMERAEERVESYWALLPNYVDSIPISATKGSNLDVLLKHILEHIPEGPRYYPGEQITDQTEYEIAAELIREAMLRYTHQEVPHASAVLVEDYEERENGIIYIAARIWVERDSQKPIVIGKEGSRLKQIGTAAREELERFLGSRVYLDLWVKVKPNWRDHEGRLHELGF